MQDNLFEERLMIEFRILASQIQEARTTLSALEPRFQKVAELIKIYGLEQRLDKLAIGDDPKRSGAATTSKGEAIASATKELLLARKNDWIKTSEIYTHLLAIGVPIGGKNPNGTLAAHLSNSKEFEGDRVRGWRLRPQTFKALIRGHEAPLETASDQSANSGPIERGPLPPNPSEEKGR